MADRVACTEEVPGAYMEVPVVCTGDLVVSMVGQEVCMEAVCTAEVSTTCESTSTTQVRLHCLETNIYVDKT